MKINNYRHLKDFREMIKKMIILLKIMIGIFGKKLMIEYIMILKRNQI